MPSLGYLELLLDRGFVIAALSAIAAFATILTLAYPLLQGDALEGRMKAVSTRRDELRLKQREAFAAKGRKGSLRTNSAGFMKRTVDNLKLEKLFEAPGTKEKLARAGLRAQRHMVAFTFFHFLMPPIAFVCSIIYVFFISDLEWVFPLKAAACIGGALVGYYLPDLYISNRTLKRQQSIMRVHRNWDPVRRIGRGVGPDHRRAFLFAGPAHCILKSCCPLWPSGC
jgi:tight adherence protein C